MEIKGAKMFFRELLPRSISQTKRKDKSRLSTVKDESTLIVSTQQRKTNFSPRQASLRNDGRGEKGHTETCSMFLGFSPSSVGSMSINEEKRENEIDVDFRVDRRSPIDGEQITLDRRPSFLPLPFLRV